jgi:hypothetical protein
VGLWSRELVLLTFFNLAWLVLQIPIVTGPPATAAMYTHARRIVDGEFVSPGDGLLALRQMFWPALKWGAPNLVIAVVFGVNFLFYAGAPGAGWAALRWLWGLLALVWFGLNLFYWPFWLAQSDRRLVTTYRNAAVFVLKAPVFALTLVILSLGLALSSLLTALPLVTVMMPWLALMGVLAVDEALQRDEQGETNARMG